MVGFAHRSRPTYAGANVGHPYRAVKSAAGLRGRDLSPRLGHLISGWRSRLIGNHNIELHEAVRSCLDLALVFYPPEHEQSTDAHAKSSAKKQVRKSKGVPENITRLS
jgi:hypothetical protein